MLTRGDKQLLGLLIVLVVLTAIATVMTRPDAEPTVWYRDGLYVLAYASSPFLDEELPSYVDQFSAQTGTKVNVVLTTDWDDAMIRAVVHQMPIDVVMVSFDMREELRREGRIIDLHTVLDAFPNPSLQTAMRWLWSSINDEPLCGFLIGKFGDPTFSCIWYQTKRVEEAKEFIKYLVVNTSVSESRLVQANHFARKYLIEQDYGPIYDYLLHPSRRKVMHRDRFVNKSTSCPDGVIRDVRVKNAETNSTAKVDPATGIRYEKGELMQYEIEYYCVQGERHFKRSTYLVQTLESPPPSVFIPDAYMEVWPHTSRYL